MHRAGKHWNLRMASQFQQAAGMRQRLIAPDIAADGTDAKHLHVGRLQQQQLCGREAVDVVFENDAASG